MTVTQHTCHSCGTEVQSVAALLAYVKRLEEENARLREGPSEAFLLRASLDVVSGLVVGPNVLR